MRSFFQRLRGTFERPKFAADESRTGERGPKDEDRKPRRQPLERLNSLDPGSTEDDRRGDSEAGHRLQIEREKVLRYGPPQAGVGSPPGSSGR